MKSKFTIEEEKTVIVNALKIAGRQAYDVARAQGLPVTVLRGNNICRIESEGKVSIVSKGRQAKYKVVKRKYSL
ncbi:hypothetical protein [uncultured Parabacteroides sp.]|uniref:hypothetical protein n=2 Tax=uncultured Parabacteroides sp. TaxID=512312 RepID=UPI00265A1B4B|nr:hypothetical protein [uncultured Parabacteroides sp.]